MPSLKELRAFASARRGLPQLGTLGAGNHYAEIQAAPRPPTAPLLPRFPLGFNDGSRGGCEVVDEIYDEFVAKKMGIDQKGQVCVRTSLK